MKRERSWKATCLASFTAIVLASLIYAVAAFANGSGDGDASTKDTASWLDEFYTHLQKEGTFKDAYWSCQVEGKGFRCERRL